MCLATSWFRFFVAGALLGACDDAGGGGGAGETESDVGTGTGTPSGTTGATMVEGSEGGSEESGSESSDTAEEIVCDPPLTKCGQTCVDLESDPNNCAICGLSCVVPNAASACVEGVCALAECDFGWVDCDGTVSTGCEMLNECDGAQACSTECGSTGALDCANPCAPVCALPVEGCNLADDDCDGDCDEGEIEGCRVGIHIGYDAVIGQVLMIDEADAATYGVTIDQMNAFYLYAAPGGGTQPMNRCANGSGELGYSSDNDCESYGQIESTLAFFSPEEGCDAIPLWRMTLDPDGVRMTANPSEVTMWEGQGWVVDPTFTGYAWAGP